MDIGYERLAEAVIVNAADDYQRALVAQKKASMEVEECERFFKGEDFKMYTKLNGEELMNKLKDEVIEYNYSLKAIAKSRQFSNGRIKEKENIESN